MIMEIIHVREYAILTKLSVDADSLDKANISEATFNFLVKLIDQKSWMEFWVLIISN